MKKIALAFLLLLPGFSSVFSQELPVIQIMNNTGVNIYGVFISTSDSEELGDNVLLDLDGEILGHAEAIEVLLHNPLSVIDTYDIFLLAENGAWYVKLGLRIPGDVIIIFSNEDLL